METRRRRKLEGTEETYLVQRRGLRLRSVCTVNTGWEAKTCISERNHKKWTQDKSGGKDRHNIEETITDIQSFQTPTVWGKDCFVCLSGGSGNYQSEGVTYEIDCKGGCNWKDEYKGESGGNAYTRGLEHLKNLRGRNATNSPLWRHCLEVHNGEIQEFEMRVTGTYRNDAMLRQITEAVQIDLGDPNRLMNTRTEWNITRVPRASIS